MTGGTQPRPGVLASTAIVAIALAVFLAPVPTDGDIVRAVITLETAGRDRTMVAGNSVVDHVSRCDADPRTIPQMLAANTQSQVVDLSYGGQPLAVTIALGALAIDRPAVRAVTLLVSPFQFNAAVGLDARTQGFFRLTSGPLAINDLAAGPLADRQLAARPTAELTPFVYAGVAYPDYAGVQARYMTPERDRMPCPETLGRDRGFITAYYWNSYLRSPIDPRYIADLAALQERAKRQRRPLTIVLLPIDRDDLAVLNPSLVAAVDVRHEALRAMLQGAGIGVVDLTAAASARDFADRWCACGHLSQRGRARVATAAAARPGSI